jgi:hypothetical protein
LEVEDSSDDESDDESAPSLLDSKKHKCARARKVVGRDLTKKGKLRIGGGRGSTIAMKKRKKALTLRDFEQKRDKA